MNTHARISYASKYIIKVAFELACLFIIVGASFVLIDTIQELTYDPFQYRYFLLGMGLYVIFKSVFPAFSRNQELVLHEYMHSIAAFLCGKKVSRFKLNE